MKFKYKVLMGTLIDYFGEPYTIEELKTMKKDTSENNEYYLFTKNEINNIKLKINNTLEDVFPRNKYCSGIYLIPDDIAVSICYVVKEDNKGRTYVFTDNKFFAHYIAELGDGGTIYEN